MKKFTNFFENFTEKNNGNDMLKTSVTNHYTPVQNILTNINNLFCCRLSIAATVAEDNVSIKLTSSKFTNDKAINDILYWPLYSDVNYQQSTLAAYIQAQGLTKVTKVNLGGGYWVVYFSPTDIKSAEDPKQLAANECPACTDCCPCPCEAAESMLDEFELSTIINEDDDEEEMKSQTVEKVLALLDGPDKVKAAKQLELLVANEIQLPREFYFAAIKFKSGEEAIALRWKYTKKMPFGKAEGEDKYKEITIENTRSIMHIFGKGDQAIWVQDFDKESIVQLPDEVKKLIENILDLLEADKTDNPAIYKLTGERKEREDKDEDKDKDENKDKGEDKDKDEKKDDDLLGGDEDKKEESDDEDDDSRGDKSDDLL